MHSMSEEGQMWFDKGRKGCSEGYYQKDNMQPTLERYWMLCYEICFAVIGSQPIF